MRYQKAVREREIQNALTRAIESAEWAGQSDDMLALLYLRNFISSSAHMQHMLRIHLHSVQPVQLRLDKLSPPIVAELYSKAHQGGPAASVVQVRYHGQSEVGSCLYELGRTAALPVLLYVRDHQGELRGELNELQFAHPKKVPEDTLHVEPEQKGLRSLFKKLWKQP